MPTASAPPTPRCTAPRPSATCYHGNYNKEGKWAFWYESGQKKAETSYKNGKKDGKRLAWYEAGQKKEDCAFKDDLEEGKCLQWYKDGKKQEETDYKAGKKHGVSTLYDEKGSKKEESNWKDGGREGPTSWYNPTGQKREEQEHKGGKPQFPTEISRGPRLDRPLPPAIHQNPLGHRVVLPKRLQPAQILRPHPVARLDLDRHKAGVAVQHKIHLCARQRAPMVELGVARAVPQPRAQVLGDQTLKRGSLDVTRVVQHASRSQRPEHAGIEVRNGQGTTRSLWCCKERRVGCEAESLRPTKQARTVQAILGQFLIQLGVLGHFAPRGLGKDRQPKGQQQVLDNRQVALDGLARHLAIARH